MLSNIYALCGKWDKISEVRESMNNLKVKKIPGTSSIEVNGVVHTFLVNDTSHPQYEQILKEINKLIAEIKEAGYKFNTKHVLHDLQEEEKENHLCVHSEKMAVAFGIMLTPPKTPLLINKNLRICPDCHSALSIISKVKERIITVRDTNRFHHFKDGKCSCNNFW